ncbi:uncharacterized protein METZ01_LOCUS301176, partial [marine metagenome]
NAVATSVRSRGWLPRRQSKSRLPERLHLVQLGRTTVCAL